jgi:hypothetical protein
VKPTATGSPRVCVTHANSVIAMVASSASIRPRPPSSKPKKRPCSPAPAIIVTRLMTAAQNVNPVDKPQPPKISISTLNDGAVEYSSPSRPVAISEKQINRRGAIRSASQPLGR